MGGHVGSGLNLDPEGRKGLEGEIGIGKPHPEAFEGALAALGVSSEPAVMIGDDLRVDIAGAQAVGLGTVWVDHRGQGPDERARPDRIVRSLAELVASD